MSGQREAADGPSGRPVTAQEAIAETLAARLRTVMQPDNYGHLQVIDQRGLESFAEDVAAAVVEAVRALPAEQVAELLGMTQEREQIIGVDPFAPQTRSFTGPRLSEVEDMGERTRFVTPWVHTPPAVQGQAHTERSE